jgi:xanthosine phosphorylase
VQSPVSLDYKGLPGFPVLTVADHAGQLITGQLNGVPVIFLNGRKHFYEAGDAYPRLTMIRTVQAAGVETLFLSNAAGSLRPHINVSELMLITDHINFMGPNPLVGPNDEVFGPRFFAVTDAWDPGLRAKLKTVAQQTKVTFHEGVYVAFRGPSFETPAEISMVQGWGADAVGMSSVPDCLIVNGDDIVITIRNLSIQGAGKGLNGIRFLKGAVLNVENCVIANQTGQGIEIVPGSNARVFIKDTIFRGNDSTPNSGGIRIGPDATFGVSALLDHVRLEGNHCGLMVEDRVTATVRNSMAAGNAAEGILVAGTEGPATLNLEGCVVAGNGTSGVRNANTGASSVIRLSNVTVTGNATGISPEGRAVIRSLGNSRIDGNTVDGKPTETKSPQ